MKTLLVALNAKYVQSNLAVRTLRTACLDYNLECEIYESNVNEQLSTHLEAIVSSNPDIIGFSCYIWNISQVQLLISDIRKLLPQVVIVLGGPEVSEVPEESLTKYKPDYVIAGAGEKAWPELILALIDGRQMPRVIRMPVSLTETQFPYLPHEDLKNHLVYYEASRGCANRCAYCLSSVNRQIEFRPLELVFDDLEKLWRMGVRQVKFVDRTFNLDKSRTMLIWQHLKEKYPEGNFHFEIAADRITDEEIEFLKKIPKGLFQMEIGVQSTYEPTLEAINRKTDITKLLQRLKELSQETDVLIYADLIAGLPYESFARFLQSFRDVIQTRTDRLHLGFLKLLPGTALRENAKELGLIYSDYPPYEILKTEQISFGELNWLKGLDWTVDTYYNSGFFEETLKNISSSKLGDFLIELTDKLKDANELNRRRKLEFRFEFLAKSYPVLADFVLIDFFKQGLSRSLPSWYEGEIYLESNYELERKLAPENKNPVLILRLSEKLQQVYQTPKIALIMGEPHIDRRCEKIIKL